MFKNLSSVWWGGVRLPKYLFLIITAGLFISCDNFLNGLDAKNELEDGISYANARSIEVLVNAAEGTGTTVPSGHYTAKSGYPFEVSFTESADYAFVGWKAVFESDGTEASEGIHFDDPSALKTNVIISTEGIKVVPQCIRRIYIDGEPLPKYEATGVSRDRSITVNFSEPPAADSFLFTEDEIPAGALPEADESGIWAYRLNGLTYFKNIEITGADEISLAAHFKKPEVDGNLLTIAVDKSNPIEIDTGASFKIIKVTISDKIKASNGITINSGKTWRYQVTNETDEKATVTLSSEVAEGSVYLAGTRDYSIGQKITLAFTESADYQFIRWDYDSSVVHVAEPLSASTTALIMEKSTGTQIKAVCAPRLRVLSFTPQNDVLSPTVSKNSSIVITFSQNLPSDEGMLNNISIAVGGSPVKNSFTSPRVNGNIITFSADKTNMLDVYAGQTKTVTVTVPADFYYETEEGYKVTYGGNGISFDYKIDNSTIEKAEIIFSSVQGSGTITPESGNVKYYSIGEEVAISFLVSDGWQFNGWKVTGADESVLSKIKIADENLPSTKLTILEAVTGVTVSADVSECLRVISKSPSAESNYKDSDIVLTFNKSLDSECSSMLNKIRISWDGTSLDGCYTERILSADGKTITVKSTAVLSVPKNTEKTISVFIPSDFFYKNSNGLKIYHEEESFSFKVNHTTKEKAKITYSVINGETENAFSPAGAAGTINRISYEEYNLGEEVDLSFDLNPGYQFYGWKIVDSDDNAVTNDIISFKNSINTDSNSTLAFNKACNGITVYAVCYLRPSITNENVSPYSSNSADEFAKNNPVTLKFAHAIKEGTEKYIEISYTVLGFSQSTYFSRSLSSDQKTVTFTPIKMLSVENAFETVTVTVPHDKVYYLAQDGKTKITPSDDDFSWSYKVNSSTMSRTVVRLDTTEANGSSINVNNIGLAGGTNQTVNVEESHSLVYPLAQGYKFMGWKITCASSGYTVSESDYVTSGTITVKNENGKTYFTLKIDDSDSTKATITSDDAIGNGTGNYGLTIGVKDSLLPKITATGPAYSTGGIDCDTPVTVTFNKAINTSTVTLGSSGTIQIVDPINENEHYESYFNSPVWNSNTDTVTIKPKYTIQELVSNGSGPKTLKVKFDLSSIIDSDGNSLVSSPESFTYRINDVMEKKEPEWYNSQYLYDGANTSRSLNNTGFSNWNTSCYTQNHIKDSIYFSMYGYDKDSGLKALRISEKYYRTVNGNEASGEILTKDYAFMQYSVKYTSMSDGTFVYRFTGIHKLQTVNDGLIELGFELIDNAGNISSTKKTYYVIKDTDIDESIVKFDETKQNALTDLQLRDGGIGLSVYNKVRKRNGDNDTVTLTLSSIPQDTFYGSYKTAYNITVKYGYTKEDITNEASKTTSSNSIKFTFTHNTRQVTFVKIIVSDAAGNTKELLRTLPGQAVIASYDTYNDSFLHWDYYRLKFANETQYKTLCSYYGASSFMTKSLNINTTEGYASCIVDSADSILSGWSWSDQFNSYLPDGNSAKGKTFYVYGLVCFKYGDSITSGDTQAEYWYSSLSDDYVKIVMKTGEDEEYLFQSDSLVTSASTGLNSNYVVDYLNVTTEPVINSGCYKVVVSDDFKSRVTLDITNITYSIIAKNYSTGEEIESKDFTFYLPSPGKYEIFLKAENSNRKSYKSSWRYLKINGTGSNQEHYLNFTQDLTAPALNVGGDDSFYSYSPAYWYTSNFSVSDNVLSGNNNAGLVTDSEGNVLLDYYFISNSNSRLSVLAWDDGSTQRYMYLHNTYTLEELEGQYSDLKKTIAVAPDATSLQIPFDGLAEGLYTICIVAKDNNGNFTVKCSTAFNKRRHQTLVLSQLYSNTYSYFFRANKRFEVKWIIAGEWIKKGISVSYGDEYDPQVEFNKGSLGNWWIKIDADPKNVRSDSGSGVCYVADSGFYDVTYLNLGYYKQLWEEGAAVMDVSSKNIIPGMNGMQVLCNSPTLAHTMYCSRKLTDGTSAEDVATWENMAMETGIVENSSNFTYSNDNYAKIPSGYYYTTIVHFADGTTLMTEVKQK